MRHRGGLVNWRGNRTLCGGHIAIPDLLIHPETWPREGKGGLSYTGLGNGKACLYSGYQWRLWQWVSYTSSGRRLWDPHSKIGSATYFGTHVPRLLKADQLALPYHAANRWFWRWRVCVCRCVSSTYQRPWKIKKKHCRGAGNGVNPWFGSFYHQCACPDNGANR